MNTLLGKTVKLANPVQGEESARYVVIEDNGDRLLCRFVCDLAIAPVELMLRSDVTTLLILDDVIEQAKSEVLEDVGAGVVPATVASFAELHDYVDANGYGGAFETDFNAETDCEFWNAVQNAVDAWIKSGAVAATVAKWEKAL